MRRPLLLALSVIAPLLLTWWAMTAASWRPVMIGRVAQPSEDTQLFASTDYVLTLSDDARGTLRHLLNVKTGVLERKTVPRQHVVGLADAGPWEIGCDKSYRHCAVEFEGQNKPLKFDKKSEVDVVVASPSFAFRFAPQHNRAALVIDYYMYTWDLQTARLQYQEELPVYTDLGQVFSEDARTLIAPTSKGIALIDALTGKIRKRVPYQGFRMLEYVFASPRGGYVLFHQLGVGARDPQFIRVVQTATGRSLWTFPARLGDVGDGNWTIADDERTIFIRDDKEWQVRKLATGKLLRRLPLIPQTSVAASSPDGSVLYYVADGVLYKQRVK